MTPKNQTDAAGNTSAKSAPESRQEASANLWAGSDQQSFEMGWGRGPRSMKRHELVSWFFSRDGI